MTQLCLMCNGDLFIWVSHTGSQIRSSQESPFKLGEAMRQDSFLWRELNQRVAQLAYSIALELAFKAISGC